jgi:hypothetical protein
MAEVQFQKIEGLIRIYKDLATLDSCSLILTYRIFITRKKNKFKNNLKIILNKL